jgi:hypothetical protein
MQALWTHNFFRTKGTNMNDKQLTIEDVIRRMNEVMREENSSKPTKMLVTPTQMAVVRKMMDEGTFYDMPATSNHIYEKEEPDEVPQVQRNDNSK